MQLAYGLAPDGRMVHITEVPSGLACSCICAACRLPLVAVKGSIRANHFRHHDVEQCATAIETALHRLAKQILEERRRLLLPALQITTIRGSTTLRPAQELTFDTVRLEQRLDSIIPDVIVTKDGYELLVEIHVTHAAPPEKVASIRALGLSSIEIDLSGEPYDLPVAEVERLLDEAPRKWLYNRFAAEKEKEARAREQDLRLREERKWKAREAARERRIVELAAAAKTAQRQAIGQGHKDPLYQELSARWPEQLLGVPIDGDYCFAVGRRQWQGVILHEFVMPAIAARLDSSRKDLGAFEIKAVLKLLSARRLVRPAFAGFIPGTIAQGVAAQIPSFLPPYQVIYRYLDYLQRKGILVYSLGEWLAHRDQVALEAAREGRKLEDEEDAEDAKPTWARGDWRGWRAKARDQLRGMVYWILERLPEEERRGFDYDAWYRQPVPGRVVSFHDCIAACDHKTFAQLRDQLSRIQTMMLDAEEARRRMRGDRGSSGLWLPPLTDDFLGLPLEAEYRRQGARRDDLTEARAERDRQIRVRELKGIAIVLLGRDAETWMSQPCFYLDGSTPTDCARESRTGLHRARVALHKEVDRRAHMSPDPQRTPD